MRLPRTVCLTSKCYVSGRPLWLCCNLSSWSRAAISCARVSVRRTTFAPIRWPRRSLARRMTSNIGKLKETVLVVGRSCGEVCRRGEVHLHALVCRFSADTLSRQTMAAMRQARAAFEGGMPVWSVTLSVA